MQNHEMSEHPFTQWLKEMPPLKEEKSPALAFLFGCVFGCIGIAIYLRSFLDFIVPFAVFFLFSLAGFGLGSIPAWMFAGVWGAMRVVHSNQALNARKELDGNTNPEVE